jgi:hypothetical protein
MNFLVEVEDVFHCNKIFHAISVSPCSANPCLNDGSCTVDVNGEAVCACNGEWRIELFTLMLKYITLWNECYSRSKRQ